MNARTDLAVFADPDLRLMHTHASGQLPYVSKGSGETVVFVHGSLCDYRYWNAQAEVLSRDFHCVSLSLSHYWPGADFGTQGTFSWATHADEVAQLIAGLDLGPVHLVGHSRGACVAFHAAHQYPQLIRSLTLADPGGPLHAHNADAGALSPATLALRAKVATLIEAGDIDAGLEMFVDSVSMPGAWSRSPAGFRAMATANANTLPLQFRDHLPAYNEMDAAELQCKTLLVGGEKSPRMYRDNIAALAQWIPENQQQVIQGASHGMNVSHPAAFNRTLQAFLSGV
ncbi:alpha/beta fold hydrolase [Herbaspirillum sp. NPDC087042]|uniref:alpha/beta fold hydrolase n=1 Tax=Herbaspirillum sp. NPDC087042 TaxID=3364004 RepID=UPI00381BB404